MSREAGESKGVNHGWARKERSVDAGASTSSQIGGADPAGGRGTRLKDLTIKRAKPAVHFGGKFRIIDFALSNCLNSGIRRIGVITQYQSHTLVQHIQRGWSFFSEEMNEFVDLLPAQQRVHGENWYRGTADAVTQNLDIIRRYKAEYVVILAGDHIYKQDYSRMLIDHVEKGARCTVACMPVPIEEASAFGVMAVDESEKIIEFVEKPANPPAMPNDATRSLASMGIYVFDADYLYELLAADDLDENSSHDFGKDIIPKNYRSWHGLCTSFPALLRAIRPASRAVLARCRDAGSLLEGQPRPGLGDAGAGYVRPALAYPYPYGIAAAGEVRAGPLRQPRHDAELAGFRRLHYLGLGGGAVGAVPASAGEFVFVTLIRQSYCRMSGSGARAACAAA